ncbi:hypothetical protein LLEC1_05302 [Akanthomyces lecanii]|uniref:Alpha/beta hydrolase fold-3 domain-containing protein n=1 Tax=Cordyceps confragosa TaxID=2714763 RepID=A0A179I2F9_CORDF|nr:hypothetical protein LLEC1_05302 [Akanthomyces lecanii]
MHQAATSLSLSKTQKMPPKLHPIHPSQENRLNAEYKAFYNANTIATPKIQTIPISVIRSLPFRPFPGSRPGVPVGKKESIVITPTSGPAKGVAIPTRCHTPPGSAPNAGWPVLVFYHGGGWTLGGLDSEADLISNICTRARLAPEHVFPAAVDDAWAALLWVATEGRARLNINRAASQGGPSIKTQLLNIPVTDNTQTVDNSACWRDLQHSPALSADLMMWFRNNYLPDKADWSHPEASPLRWTGDWSTLPPAVIVVAGMDVLRDEGEAYGEKLKQAGVNVQITTFRDQPHVFPAMGGVLEDARRAVTIMCESMHDSFYKSNSIFARSKI